LAEARWKTAEKRGFYCLESKSNMLTHHFNWKERWKKSPRSVRKFTVFEAICGAWFDYEWLIWQIAQKTVTKR